VELPEVLVNVNATPWAEVWIDGKHVGQTPLARVPVVIGTHEVVFRHPELGEKTVTALIRADVPNRLTADLRQQSR
jgi:serine/threonine-protein kinase